MSLMPTTDDEILATYVGLADIARQSLALVRKRDWEALAVQQACEAELLARLQSLAEPFPLNADMRERQAQLIRQILAAHEETEALLQPWRDEIAAELQCADSSRRLARAYIAQPGGF
jgi:hypothetical protein